MPVQCVLQTIADSRRMVAPRVWGSLPNTIAKKQSSESLQACFFLSLPITFSLSLFQAGLLLPADFSQPSANLLIFLPCSSQVSLFLPSTHPSPSIPQSQQMERSTVHTERRQETPRETYDEPSTSCAHDCREVRVLPLLP